VECGQPLPSSFRGRLSTCGRTGRNFLASRLSAFGIRAAGRPHARRHLEGGPTLPDRPSHMYAPRPPPTLANPRHAAPPESSQPSSARAVALLAIPVALLPRTRRSSVDPDRRASRCSALYSFSYRHWRSSNLPPPRETGVPGFIAADFPPLLSTSSCRPRGGVILPRAMASSVFESRRRHLRAVAGPPGVR